MSKIFSQRKPEKATKVLPAEAIPISADWSGQEMAAIVSFSDGGSSPGSCIRCFSPPCIQYSNDELALPGGLPFPADMENHVCPTSAIEWPIAASAPVVDADQCILCGICLSRCPVRAIYLTQTGAVINDEPNLHFELSDAVSTQELTKQTARRFGALAEEGPYIDETDDILSHFRARLDTIGRDQVAQFPNLLARNLMIALGPKATMRRMGDTNIRMDLLIDYSSGIWGPGEVELGPAILDVPRDLLDDVAVLVSRYSTEAASIVPLAIFLSLPNRRSEYWGVVSDIEEVLSIRISTVTLGMLALLVWNRATVNADAIRQLRMFEEQPSLLGPTEAILERELDLSQGGYPGMFESEK